MQGSNYTAWQFVSFHQLENIIVNDWLAIFSVNKCYWNTQTFVVVSNLVIVYCSQYTVSSTLRKCSIQLISYSHRHITIFTIGCSINPWNGKQHIFAQCCKCSAGKTIFIFRCFITPCICYAETRWSGQGNLLWRLCHGWGSTYWSFECSIYR